MKGIILFKKYQSEEFFQINDILEKQLTFQYNVEFFRHILAQCRKL